MIKEAKQHGYQIREMGIAGGSAGHAFAVIYVYRDASEALVPIK